MKMWNFEERLDGQIIILNKSCLIFWVMTVNMFMFMSRIQTSIINANLASSLIEIHFFYCKYVMYYFFFVSFEQNYYQLFHSSWKSIDLMYLHPYMYSIVKYFLHVLFQSQHKWKKAKRRNVERDTIWYGIFVRLFFLNKHNE